VGSRCLKLHYLTGKQKTKIEKKATWEKTLPITPGIPGAHITKSSPPPKGRQRPGVGIHVRVLVWNLKSRKSGKEERNEETAVNREGPGDQFRL